MCHHRMIPINYSPFVLRWHTDQLFIQFNLYFQNGALCFPITVHATYINVHAWLFQNLQYVVAMDRIIFLYKSQVKYTIWIIGKYHLNVDYVFIYHCYIMCWYGNRNTSEFMYILDFCFLIELEFNVCMHKLYSVFVSIIIIGVIVKMN